MLLLGIAGVLIAGTGFAQGPAEDAAPGQLTIMGPDGKAGPLCPLEGTKVDADIAGFGARVTVVQTFANPTRTPIEALYTFPLPADAAVDRMRMQVGDRVVEGMIRRREEARRIYEAAKSQGQVAGLLDQERPNLFTQSVANIMPGAKVRIEISYVQVLKYEEGQFEFSFPMVVGPRFVTAKTPDNQLLTPPIVPKGMRTGANIELTARLDAGAPIQNLESVLHATSTKRDGPSRATITLSRKDEIPNRDFILRYRVAGDGVTGAVLTHADPQKGGFFTLVLMPPKEPRSEDIAPKEVVFVMDQSGSQSGFPIEKSKELTLQLIRTLNPEDTFNVISFANGVRQLWSGPRRVTSENLGEAQRFVEGLQANGGTQLLSAVQAALQPEPDPDRLRLVVFNTDGFVGNEFEILDAIQKNRGAARMFTFGIGNSVNRFLIDSMSAEGKGDSEIVTLAEGADKAVERFVQRTRSPILTDVSVRFEGVSVDQVLPEAIPDVFSEKPIVVKGRYSQPGTGRVIVSGKYGGEVWTHAYPVVLPARDQYGSAIASLWARERVDQLMRQNWLAAQRGGNAEDTSAIVDVALEFGIMSQYTSFVAVESRVVNIGGKQRTVRVPVEMADGVSYEGIFGNRPGAFARSASGGFGGGGFGGGGFSGAAAAKSLSTTTPPARDKAETKSGMTEKELHEFNVRTKIAQPLRGAKGQQEVQIWLADTDPGTLDKLKKAGAKVEVVDEGLRVVFGIVDAAKLEALAQIEQVQRIEKI
ncbi:MAG: VWA domain-containing protein [Chthonomonadaceae bacterium]|nr:VWA domain-containing protein [Chthonomonadaceae bacterium]